MWLLQVDESLGPFSKISPLQVSESHYDIDEGMQLHENLYPFVEGVCETWIKTEKTENIKEKFTCQEKCNEALLGYSAWI